MGVADDYLTLEDSLEFFTNEHIRYLERSPLDKKRFDKKYDEAPTCDDYTSNGELVNWFKGEFNRPPFLF